MDDAIGTIETRYEFDTEKLKDAIRRHVVSVDQSRYLWKRMDDGRREWESACAEERKTLDALAEFVNKDRPEILRTLDRGYIIVRAKLNGYASEAKVEVIRYDDRGLRFT